MQALIRFFIELCLLRRTPQQLPASDALFVLMLAADLVAGLLVGIVAGQHWWASLTQGTAELALMLLILWLALSLIKHPGRFLQAATALLGTGALIGVLALVPLAMNPSGTLTSDLAALGAVLFLALVIWSLIITGHILRHTFEITLGQGTAIAVAFEVFSVAMISALLG